MNLITIDADKCRRDGLCVQACPVNILQGEKGALPAENPEATTRCIDCGHCVAICPTGALTHKRLPFEDFLPVAGNWPSEEQTEVLLTGRRSVRSFRKAPVPREQLERLLDVARRAPTASNTQKVHWSVVLDPQRLDRIRELSLDWLCSDPSRAYHRQAANEGRDPILRGGTVLAVAHAPQKYVWTDSDCAIALTYMELHAAAMGLGACWGGLVTKAAHNRPELTEILGVPEDHRVGGALMLGQVRNRHQLVPPRNPVRVKWL